MRWTAQPAISLLVLLTFVIGCHTKRSSTDAGYPTTASALEISTNPGILATHKGEWKDMTLYGIRLGDPETVLPNLQIVEQINGGWIVMRNGNKYLSGNDNHIDAFSICERKLLAVFDVRTKDEVYKVFGKDAVPVEAPFGNTIFYCQDRHIRVVWNLLENRVTAVDVWK